MGIVFWSFMANDTALVRIPLTRIVSIHDGHIKVPHIGPFPPDRPERLMAEAILDVNKRVALRCVRILFHRIWLTPDGFYDRIQNGQLAMRLLEARYTGDFISHIEAAANHFWTPNDAQWSDLVAAIGLPLEHLKAAEFR